MRVRWYAGLLSIVLCAAAGRASADPVPARNQALLVMRILAYDHNLASRIDKKTVTIVVLYKPGVTESEEAAADVTAQVREIAKSTTVANNAIQVIRVPFAEKTFVGDLERIRAGAIYVTPGLAEHLGAVTMLTKQRKLLSFTGSVEYVSSGISVGFALQDKKPTVLVNLPASKGEGANLDPAFLRVAKIVKK